MKEAPMTQSDPDAFRTICSSKDIPDGYVAAHYLADRKLRIALAHVGGRFYAFDDLCPCAQRKCPLSAGLLTGTTILCQCHGSKFDIATGAVLGGPARDSLTLYEAHEAGGAIQIRLHPNHERNVS
jgi:3-phenylpropionate/trans-cinnamate dioxygenase ferredoxin component